MTGRGTEAARRRSPRVVIQGEPRTLRGVNRRLAGIERRLARIIPFDEWMRRQNPSDGQKDIYRRVVAAFEAEPKEVFANAAKSGTEMSHILADACVIISLALQFGTTPDDIAKSLGRVPELDRGKGADKPASVLGEIMAIVSSARSEWPATVQHLGCAAPPTDSPPAPEGSP